MYKNQLKEVREKYQITQEQLASKIELTRGSYGHFENEDDIFPITTLNKISNYFNVSIDYLFSFTNINNYSNSKKELDIEKSKLRIKEFRKDNKLTQMKLAKELNVANGTIANYECGRNFIATPFLYEICQKYKISADYLLGKTDEPKYLEK